MAVNVRIPTPLRGLTKDQDVVSAEGPSVGAAIEELERSFPGMKNRLCDETGELRRFVNIYVNGEDVRFLQGLETPIADRDEMSIVPAVAGG